MDYRCDETRSMPVSHGPIAALPFPEVPVQNIDTLLTPGLNLDTRSNHESRT